MKPLLDVSLIACLFIRWGFGETQENIAASAIGGVTYVGKLAALGLLLGIFETAIAKMRVFRVAEFLGIALMLGLLARCCCLSRGASSDGSTPDLRRRSSSGRWPRSVSSMLLYQDRMFGC